MISSLSSFAIGSMAFYMESSIKSMELWLALFFVFSGYLILVELFPPAVRGVAEWLAFRFQFGPAAELMTATHDRAAAFALPGCQWIWVAVLLAGAILQPDLESNLNFPAPMQSLLIDWSDNLTKLAQVLNEVAELPRGELGPMRPAAARPTLRLVSTSEQENGA